MGDYTRNCKRNAPLEGSSTGATAISKRRRVACLPDKNAVELEKYPRSFVDFSKNAAAPANSAEYRATSAGVLCSSFCSDQFTASCCSSNESSEVARDNLRLMDLEVNFKFEFLNLMPRSRWSIWFPLSRLVPVS